MKKENQKEGTGKYDVEFFKQEYDRNNPICDGAKCNVIDQCVMDLWEKDTPRPVRKAKREEIMQGLAELSVKINQEIAELFRRVNDGKLPTEPPVFKLVLLHCESHKAVPIDYGD